MRVGRVGGGRRSGLWWVLLLWFVGMLLWFSVSEFVRLHFRGEGVDSGLRH